MYKSAEYATWASMRARCNSTRYKDAISYLERGIIVCDRWNSFEAFFADMGPKPSTNHTLERIDNGRGYEPDNVKWATRTEQQRNRRNNRLLTIQGETMTYSAWASRLGVDWSTIDKRVKRGWTDEQILAPSRLNQYA
jgi:hypothetical protein